MVTSHAADHGFFTRRMRIRLSLECPIKHVIYEMDFNLQIPSHNKRWASTYKRLHTWIDM